MELGRPRQMELLDELGPFLTFASLTGVRAINESGVGLGCLEMRDSAHATRPEAPKAHRDPSS